MERRLKDTAKIAIPGMSRNKLMDLYNEWQNSDTPYNKVASIRGYNGPDVTAEQLASEVPVHKRKSFKILDVGAGTGLVAERLLYHGFTNIDSLEPCALMIEDARKKNLYKNYYEMFFTGNNVTLKSDSYDAVVTCGTFMENHMPLDTLPELIRIVKKDGVIVFTTRYKYLETVEAYKDKFEPYLKDLEILGKWKKISRVVFPRYYQEDDGIVWKYIVV